jgi:thioredoxin reductase
MTMERRTAIPGFFAVGVCVKLLGQISVAAGQAAVAATTIHNDPFGGVQKESRRSK